MSPEHVLVVGAGLGGIRTVEQLRRVGYEGSITLVGAEERLPYDRPPLSKQLLAGDWEPARIALKDAAALEELGARTCFGLRAVALRPGEVEFADGSIMAADAIVLATGLSARKLPGQPDSVHTLRTLDNALSLREDMATAKTLLVVGAGFIGAEVASTAMAKGIATTIVEAAPVPLLRGLGEEVGAIAGRLMAESGVELRLGVAITGFANSDAGAAVDLSDGSRVEADVAVVGIGGRPEVDYLSDTGLDLVDGVPCDANGRVVGLNGVWAVGDMAAWTDPALGGHRRHEHWTSTSDQALVVARAITGAEVPPPAVPYFWSDQFGLKIQLIGRPDIADEIVALRGEGLAGGLIKGTVVGYLWKGLLVAVAGFGAARHVARCRALLMQSTDRTAAVEFARSF
ncbi:NAD(P)/FAD-dependent oxidoreductase [Saccharopolyspora sp. ASAGF58]|uniref:NAD(P)/FAD-dependent oxidoreductase n=1 Tax=Saccharopolyspora sp. ASAGF58 TaxID=2719023 RepID=UPI00143FBE8E|nr:FAD-dependent oxidoreductase [Saccharopolyspora sp. ASAGF58]QIZ38000.1 ferredoxin reductase [Saccharopolyspora sp. ASAGF58]